eukprot:1194789-Prorocentrum_minimum.AAC.3
MLYLHVVLVEVVLEDVLQLLLARDLLVLAVVPHGPPPQVVPEHETAVGVVEQVFVRHVHPELAVQHRVHHVGEVVLVLAVDEPVVEHAQVLVGPQHLHGALLRAVARRDLQGGPVT